MILSSSMTVLLFSPLTSRPSFKNSVIAKRGLEQMG